MRIDKNGKFTKNEGGFRISFCFPTLEKMINLW